MGQKGAKLSEATSAACDDVVGILKPVGNVTSKKMFGGYGIFESGVMFGLMDSQGALFWKADDTNRAAFEEAGSEQHGKMPYFRVPTTVLNDKSKLRKWARTSIEVAMRSKKK